MMTSDADMKGQEQVFAFLGAGGQAGTLLRSVNWSASAVGDATTWPPALKTALSICLGSAAPCAVLWGAELTLFYNDAYCTVLAERHPAAMGRPVAEVWPDLLPTVGVRLQRVMEKGEGISLRRQPLTFSRAGETVETFWDYAYAPIRSEDGSVGGILVTVSEVTDVIVNERRLTQRAQQQQTMFQKMPGFVAFLRGEDHVYEYANDAYRDITGGRDLIGLPAKQALAELAGQGFFEVLDRVYAEGSSFSATGMKVRLKGEATDRFIDFVFQALRDETGHVNGIFVGGHEVTAHLEAQRAVSVRERELQTLTDALPILISYVDHEERYQFVNKFYETWFPRTRESMIGKTLLEVVGPEAYAKVKHWIDAALAGERLHFEQHMPYSTTSHRDIRVEYIPRFDADGGVEGFYTLVQDISDIKAVEARQRDLTHELSHRIKNSLAMVQAIVSQSLRNADDTSLAQEVISARLSAMSRAQDILTNTNWASADIREVLDVALKPYLGGGDRFTFTGPSIQLSAQQGLGLSLAMHELATNATKYGSLSVIEGTVDIEWLVDENGQFVFDWAEIGGPAVEAPTRKGFGSRLIERSVAPYFEGACTLSYLSSGVRFNLVGKILHE
ncbi:PAS domain-containing protein [Agrobacterium sp.]|uniref:PAS domain-containing sensor histidine kinase n=1 Tax=Agrobacterium sp. TaxID=361 RepID=UPI0028A5C2D7|nr:PAS domain-containing protein [Agrobacterium sp.]